MSASTTRIPSERARRVIEDNLGRLTTWDAAKSVWEQVFSLLERRSFGDDLDFAFKQVGVIEMWRRARGDSSVRAAIEIPYELGGISSQTRQWLLREIGEEDFSSEILIQQAINERGLVLVDNPRSASWDGRSIDVEWDTCPALWSYLWALAKAAKSGDVLDQFRLAEGNPGVLKNRKFHLGKKVEFPRSLFALIEGGQEHRLNIPPDLIVVFEFIDIDQYRRWTP